MGDKESKHKRIQDQLFDASFEMKMQAKTMDKEAQKSMAKAEQQKARAKQFLDKGDMESAKMIAAESIRLKKESINQTRMGAKLGAVAAKLDSASRANEVSQQIKQAVPSLNNALKMMKSNKISENMGDFEKVFEDLDVQIETMNGAMDGVTASSADSNAVDDLIAEMQGAAGLEVGSKMGQAQKGKIAGPEQVA